MQSTIDIPPQCGQTYLTTPRGDSVTKCVEHTRAFANFAPSPGIHATDEEREAYRKRKRRPVQVTPILLGDRYPVITVTRAYKHGAANDEVEYTFNVPDIRHGFGADLDAAIIAAIAVKNGAGSMEAAAIAKYALRMIRGADFSEDAHASGWE